MSIVNNYLNEIRHEFSSQKLDESSVNPDPIKQLEKWIEEAVDSQILEPNAMVVTTVSEDLKPSSRVVYIRGIDDRGLLFYTNYLSRKGQEIEGNDRVALLFFYSELERQVRVEGVVEKLSDSESDAYFAKRPRESQLGAWASDQSSDIPGRDYLENRLKEFDAKYPDEVPRPPHWGGYVVIPDRFEFWQGRPARLHDRVYYSKSDSDQWKLGRLSP
jgi:pyridoxamine 5'-phosphate oxidase